MGHGTLVVCSSPDHAFEVLSLYEEMFTESKTSLEIRGEISIKQNMFKYVSDEAISTVLIQF